MIQLHFGKNKIIKVKLVADLIIVREIVNYLRNLKVNNQ